MFSRCLSSVSDFSHFFGGNTFSFAYERNRQQQRKPVDEWGGGGGEWGNVKKGFQSDENPERATTGAYLFRFDPDRNSLSLLHRLKVFTRVVKTTRLAVRATPVAKQ